MVKIGNVELRGNLTLGPMAGVTDFAFRALCRQQGAALTTSEMGSARALVYRDEKTKALIANTIFMNEGCGYRLQEGFVDKVNTYYDAQPQNRDFADGETVDVINQWANDHTEGMIPKVLDETTFNPSAVSYLLNALYFRGIWSSPFKKEDTKNEPFGGGDEVPMMRKDDAELLYAENDL